MGCGAEPRIKRLSLQRAEEVDAALYFLGTGGVEAFGLDDHKNVVFQCPFAYRNDGSVAATDRFANRAVMRIVKGADGILRNRSVLQVDDTDAILVRLEVGDGVDACVEEPEGVDLDRETRAREELILDDLGRPKTGILGASFANVGAILFIVFCSILTFINIIA